MTMSPRVVEVLQLIANGCSNKNVAERLVIDVETVKSHVKKCLDVLDARNRAHAVAIGLRRGIIR